MAPSQPLNWYPFSPPPTLDALENKRAGELGFVKLTKLLAALGLELKLQASGTRRPTLDELLEEEHGAQSLDRRR